jgi:spermidine synthase
LFYLCVFSSGCAGLIYEVVWTRQITLLVGTTAYAHIAVLTAFMAGLASGSYFIGKVADRKERGHPWTRNIDDRVN